MKKIRPKRFIEIYFVLYLAALVLLIPDKKHEDKNASSLLLSLLQSSFVVQPERTTMLCRVIRSGDKMKIVTCDSSNTIYHSGNVEDVRYEFSIEDQSYKTPVVLTSGQNVQDRIFRLSGHPEEGSIHFAWQPPVEERRNRIYRVNVRASATPILPATLTNEQRTYIRELSSQDGGLRLHATTQFTVALIYVDGGSDPLLAGALNQQTLAQSDSSMRAQVQQLVAELERGRGVAAPTGNFVLEAREPVIRCIASLPFESHIRVNGADPQRDLSGPAILTGPNAHVSRIESGEIVVQGTAPLSGIVLYRLTAQRASDRKDTSVTFSVVAQPLSAPGVPQKMFPGVEYTFNPNLPETSGAPASAVLLDDKNNELASSIQGESFTYKTTNADTNRVFHFERLINGKKIGQSYAIVVSSFPPPEVIDIIKQNGIVRVRTRSFGLSDDNRARVRLEVSGSTQSKIQEQHGDWKYDEKYNAHLQIFQFSTQQPVITVRAYNGYRIYSEKQDFRVRD